VNDRFFKFESSGGKTAYIPVVRLLRIETVANANTVSVIFEQFQVNATTLDGLADDVAYKLYNQINHDSREEIPLTPKTSNVTAVHF
jgi:hypothetical protein